MMTVLEEIELVYTNMGPFQNITKKGVHALVKLWNGKVKKYKFEIVLMEDKGGKKRERLRLIMHQ